MLFFAIVLSHVATHNSARREPSFGVGCFWLFDVAFCWLSLSRKIRIGVLFVGCCYLPIIFICRGLSALFLRHACFASIQCKSDVLLQFCGECIREWLEKSAKEAKRREREREGKERKDSDDDGDGEEKGTCPHCRAEITGPVCLCCVVCCSIMSFGMDTVLIVAFRCFSRRSRRNYVDVVCVAFGVP